MAVVWSLPQIQMTLLGSWTVFFLTQFFTEFERFDRFVHMTQRKARTQDGDPIDYLSVCSPNYLHDAHIRFGLRSGCDVICEKPLVINPWNIDGIEDLEESLRTRSILFCS